MILPVKLYALVLQRQVPLALLCYDLLPIPSSNLTKLIELTTWYA